MTPTDIMLFTMKLQSGSKAPTFSAKDQNGKTRKLTDFKGKWLVLYFYPKDFTSGCTKEACSFRDNYSELNKLATIVGISADSTQSHKKFSKQHKLPFFLLSDPERKIIKDYGAKTGIFARRFTYLIDPMGNIAKIYKTVKPNVHAQQVLIDISKLKYK